jgi:YegS/Rv2252/BmrU family lipid kinase
MICDGRERSVRDLPSSETVVIVNPIAGAKGQAARYSILSLVEHSPNIQAQISEYPGHAEQLAREAAQRGAGIVVAAGGDGTVNEVMRGLLGTGVAMGVVPLGSGNGFARHLGISHDPRVALERLAAPRILSVDVGLINEHPFVCTAGLGFDGYVSRLFSASKKRGLAAYVGSAVRAYLSYRSFDIRLQFNDTDVAAPCYLLAFANACQYGNNAFIAPHANCSDGLLDLCHITRLPPWRALDVGIRLMRGTLSTRGDICYHSADSVRVEADAEVDYHVDGDYVGRSREFSVKTRPNALEVAL